MNPIDELYNISLEMNCGVIKNADLSEYTSFKIGGPASILVMPDSSTKAGEILEISRQMNIPVLILGNGSNILISDAGFEGIVICTARLDYCELQGDGVIDCGAGLRLVSLCRFALEHSLTGIEFAYGIPGSAGGAVYMNAGAYGGEMKDILYACHHIAADLKFGTFDNSELNLGYRSSIYSNKDFLITGLRIHLNQGSKNDIESKMNTIINSRREKQPLDLPSAGSVFKRPVNTYAAKLIDECGLKGYTVGGAMVSHKHAGFIVNTGQATAADVKKLIEIIKDTVYRKTSILLETEIVSV